MINKSSINVKTIFLLTGAILAFLIGAATATGQEALQFFSAHGYYGVGSIIVFTVLLGWSGASIISLGYRKENEVHSVYKYYLGNFLGTIFDWLLLLFLYGVVVTMLSGSGAVMNETFGLSYYVGSLVVGSLVFLTVILSLQRIIQILGWIGPILIVFLCIISLVSIFKSFKGLSNLGQTLSTVEAPSASGFWWLSGILYASFAIVVAAPFFFSLGTGSKLITNRKEATASGISAAFAAMLPISLMFMAILANIESVYDKAAPLVYLAQNIHPYLPAVYAIIILLGVYSTVVPMLWLICDKIFQNHDKKYYKLFAAVLTVLALAGGSVLPFGQLVGFLYPLMGFVGLILFLLIGYRQIIERLKKE